MGERRLEAFRVLGRETIPVLDIKNLDDDTAYILELEENFKRKNLRWQEEAEALEKIHTRCMEKDPSWTRIAQLVGWELRRPKVSQYLLVAEAMKTDKEIGLATTIGTAYQILQKRSSRELDDMATTIGFNLRTVLGNTPSLAGMASKIQALGSARPVGEA